jgi:FMN-dependent NADH-azoreductase
MERTYEIFQQFKSANRYVVVLQLHNFNISSKLKDYMENIMIAGDTLKYTEDGSAFKLFKECKN